MLCELLYFFSLVHHRLPPEISSIFIRQKVVIIYTLNTIRVCFFYFLGIIVEMLFIFIIMICYLLKSSWFRNFNFFVGKENFMVCTPKVALIIISIYFFREFFFPATQNLNPKSIRSNKFIFIINTLFVYSQYIFSLNLKTCYIGDKNSSTITSLVYYIILIDYISFKILTRSSPFFSTTKYLSAYASNR